MPLKQAFSKPHAIVLFETKHAAVRAVVVGPKIGFRWRQIKYYRWEMSARQPGRWEEVTGKWRSQDNRPLGKCVAEVQAFLDADSARHG